MKGSNLLFGTKQQAITRPHISKPEKLLAKWNLECKTTPEDFAVYPGQTSHQEVMPEVWTAQFKTDGKLHRTDGPAWIQNVRNKRIARHWYQNGKKHRENGPCYEIIDCETGEILVQAWFENGVPHRADGPQEVRDGKAVVWAFQGKIFKNKQEFYDR